MAPLSASASGLLLLLCGLAKGQFLIGRGIADITGLASEGAHVRGFAKTLPYKFT